MTRLPYRGGAVALLLVLVLVTPPTELVEQSGSYADTRGDIRTPMATPIDISGGLVNDPAATVPRDLGNWTGNDDDSWPPELQNSLHYDSLLVRHYSRPGFYTPVQLMIITAEHADAFHNPTVCFRVQGNSVKLLDETTINVAGQEHRVGRMVVSQDGQADRIVYNIYLVTDSIIGKDRTTWMRLTFYGANETTEPQLEPYLTGLMEDIAPHAFHNRDAARTTIGALWGMSPFIGILAIVAALAPIGIELLVRRK